MAYGNWGGVVIKNGIRRQDREDTIPYHEDDLEGDIPMLRAFARRDLGRPSHVVLGDGPLRLCGYKSWPIIYVNGERLTDAEMNNHASRHGQPRTGSDVDYTASYYGTIEGVRFVSEFIELQTGEAVDLCLREDGNIWLARCGYGIGSGHEELKAQQVADLWNELMARPTFRP